MKLRSGEHLKMVFLGLMAFAFAGAPALARGSRLQHSHGYANFNQTKHSRITPIFCDAQDRLSSEQGYSRIQRHVYFGGIFDEVPELLSIGFRIDSPDLRRCTFAIDATGKSGGVAAIAYYTTNGINRLPDESGFSFFKPSLDSVLVTYDIQRSDIPRNAVVKELYLFGENVDGGFTITVSDIRVNNQGPISNPFLEEDCAPTI